MKVGLAPEEKEEDFDCDEFDSMGVSSEHFQSIRRPQYEPVSYGEMQTEEEVVEVKQPRARKMTK